MSWIVRTPKVIFDCGSFDGADALRMRAAYPEAIVVAIEADPVRVEVVRRNIAGRGIVLVHCALFDENKRMDWYQRISRERGNEISSSNSLYPWTDAVIKRFAGVIDDMPDVLSVNARRLDDVWADMKIPEIDILHTDVEGAELPMLMGMGLMRPRMIYVETLDYWIGSPKPSDVHEYLSALGYRRINKMRKDSLYEIRSER